MNFKLVKTGIWFKAAFDEDYELIKRIPQGAIIAGKTEKQRNYQFHRKLFAVLKIGYDNQELYDNMELYRARVLIAAGHCDIIMLESGHANFIPKSISYEAIPDDHEFGILYNKVVEKVAQFLNVTNQELAMQVASEF
jgi:hypothetical protein